MEKFVRFFENLSKRHIDFAVIKLSIFYVLIVMVISVSFSFGIYNISKTELGRGLGKQARVLQDIPLESLPSPIRDFEQMRVDQIEESNKHLSNNLVYFNFSILLLAAISSYFFAKKTLDPIKKAMEAQNRFTADASHELRTPLTAMKSEIEVALRDTKFNTAAAKELLASNLEEISKLEALSSALLKLARSENANLEFGKVDVFESIIESYEKVELLAEKKSIEINFKHPEDAGFLINGDHQSLSELFVILLDNAIKYSPSNSKINIILEKEKDHVVVKIQDHGAGIKACDLPYIFNRFYRADSSRSKETVSGYGLGLSIAKQIVDLHNGTISVTSKPGKGSEFKVIL